MAEQVFLSPNFFEREIDQSQRTSPGPVGVPAGVIGTAIRGPAFVPVTVGNFTDFIDKFGGFNPDMIGPYAADLFLNNRQALTYLRVLGAGANSTTSDFEDTRTKGIVKNAGFKVLSPGVASSGDARNRGSVQFISADHEVAGNEVYGYPVFSHNNSVSDGAKDTVNLIRGMLLLATGSRAMIIPVASASSNLTGPTPTVFSDRAEIQSSQFKIVISSSLGSAYSNNDNIAGFKTYSVSLNPDSDNYISKVLNTDPTKFVAEQHLLYAHYPVDAAIVTAKSASLLSGSNETSSDSGDTNLAFRDLFGRFDTRYKAAKTPQFISQPFGEKEFDLFRLEAIDDGDFINDKIKISIANLKASDDETNPYGTFSVLVRDWSDSDKDMKVIEQFNNCSLDPNAGNYVARVIGDLKVSFNHDSATELERGLVLSGKYPNVSKYVRVVVSSDLENNRVPAKALPFGFRGISVLKTTDTLNDTSPSSKRLTGFNVLNHSGSIVPPVPFRYKVTDGAVSANGSTGKSELTNANYFWGVKFEKVSDVLNSNLSGVENELVKNLTKFNGVFELDAVVTGSGADLLNNNKFTLAKVTLGTTDVSFLTGTLSQHMRDAKYIRNGVPDSTTYQVNNSITFATLLSQQSSITFNRYSQYAKFTTILQGGFNGVNILNKDDSLMNDKASSFSEGASSTNSPGLSSDVTGAGKLNNAVASYATAARIMTDKTAVRHNLLTVPGITENYLTDYISDRIKNEYGLALYLMDLPSYDSNNNIIYSTDRTKPSVNKTIDNFAGRVVDNNFVSTYFPDVFIDAPTNASDRTITKRIKAPASLAALAAISFNDNVSYPWYAPAGFNRGALEGIVKNTTVRLSVDDRNSLYEARINPIANFPREGYVIFGQKTLQLKKSSLDRVNVRRLLLELRRIVRDISVDLLFEQNTPQLRAQFINSVTTQLAIIQLQQGIESFRVVMDDTNNTAEDALNNRLNGRILIVPTRAIEFIAIDFIITNSGVQFI